MNTSIVVLMILLAVVAIRSIFNIVVALANISWLGKGRHNIQTVQLASHKNLFLLLPVYLEQKLIGQVIESCYKLIKGESNIFLVIITTGKETNNFTSRDSTFNIAKHKIESLGAENILIVHYPHNGGSMPEQLDYAAQEIIKSYKVDDAWFLTLNIDSKYDEQAFSNIINLVNGEEKIYQHSAFFLSNFNSFHRLERVFLQAAAIFQSRWTIVHEIKRYRVNTSGKFFSKYQLAHAVGHGLLIPVSIFRKYCFPVDEIIEDSPFGYLLRCEGYVINPVQNIETADSPHSFLEHIKQKYTWSFGPMGYWKYFRKYRDNFKAGYSRNKFKVIALTTQGLLSAINWQLSSWIFLYLIAGLFYAGNVLASIIISVLVLYTVDYIISMLYFKRAGYISLSAKSSVLLYLNLWAVILIHSLPANYALLTVLLKQVGLKKNITKFKTEHR